MDEKEAEALFADDKPVVMQEPVAEAAEPVATPEPVEGVTTATPPVAEQNSAKQLVPLQVILDERDKRQQLQRDKEKSDQELAALREKLAAFEASKNAAPPPDLYTDPEARLQFENSRFQTAIINTKLEQSRFLAEREYGKEAVDAAYAYFDQHPHLSHQFLAEPSPFHAAVEFYKRQKAAEEVGSDPVAYRARIASELEAEIRAKVLAEASSAPQPKLPGSLASAPAAGRANANPAASDMEGAIH